MSRAALSGWGRTHVTSSHVVPVASEDDVAAALAAGGPIIARGLGRSYGDAAQVSGGAVMDLRGLSRVGAIDERGVVTLGAGVSFDELLQVCVPQGWFVPVTPGTRQVTMGGAIGADVHGKNHHVDGSFANHVLSLRLVTPVGPFTLSAKENPGLFWATMGAMGLTGVVTEVTIQLLAIETDRVLVDTERFADLDAVMAAMSSGDDDYRYSVAWVDCMTRGAHAGRAILTRANHARASDVTDAHLEPPNARAVSVPFVAPSGLLNRATVRAFNELWFRAAPRRDVASAHSLSSFFHPLDGLADWNRLYGPRGFLQYQFCLPDEAGESVRTVIERLSSSRVPSFLAVLKRFGPANPAPLSFPLAGWTLALDLPIGPAQLAEVLDQLDDVVAHAGGRVYLAKDARLAPERLREMYPRLDEFLDLKSQVDPRGVLTSDLAERLHLVGR